MHHFLDDFGYPATLTYDPAVYQQRVAKHVLIFPFWQGKLLFTRHRLRGIELPGGKVEPGETSIAAAIRETFEETGAVLDAIERIGQYTVGNDMVKDIYVARVLSLQEQAIGTDVEGAIWFDEIPENVKGQSPFSRYLYDDVYPYTLTRLSEHPFTSSPKKES
ncbi:NUDIX domain-containing protein [Brevibacillus ruminantium]|uniref:NUDIX domain-containing protein n=1 Tax=Brevibacillus ruminantium TaxID=2950604 RepID=A0ABY4WL51_9BACL|nr:NUDIX domain-containing protein [Brevibacillus ruminantium]USG67584.1 NUDIX domain-containing protein [Brevibacillus ruminantium]